MIGWVQFFRVWVPNHFYLWEQYYNLEKIENDQVWKSWWNWSLQTIVDAIINYWIKIFRWFEVFESDWCQGINSKVLEALTRAANIKLELAEPRNPRGIGKIEQTMINFMTTFTPGRFLGYLFRHFSIDRIKRKISSFIFEYDW